MDFKTAFNRGVELVKLNRDAAEAVASDETAFTWAMLFYAIGGFAAAISYTAMSFGLGGIMLIFSPVAHVLISFVYAGILHFIAKLFGGTGTYKGYYSALGIGSLPGWAKIVPIFGGIAALWYIPVSVIVTERVHKLSFGKAVAVVVIPVTILFILILLAVAILGYAVFMGIIHTSDMPKWQTI
ncbi:MAG TPA: YIP1 family protein [Nitrospirota bacterium]